jgi:hypothetical protein
LKREEKKRKEREMEGSKRKKKVNKYKKEGRK